MGSDPNGRDIESKKAIIVKIGFGQTDITCPVGTLLCGQPFEYHARGVENSLYATAMYLDDGTTQTVLISCDVLMFTNETMEAIRRQTQADTGIPAENVIICTTHTHSGPSTLDVLGAQVDRGYMAACKSNIVRATKQAKRHAVEGTLKLGFGEIPGYAFNRRFLMSDGTVSTHPQKLDPHIVEPEGPDSKDLNVMCGYAMNGRPLGAAVCFVCHGTVLERDNELISSDYPGKVTQEVASGLGQGCVCLFLQGACGNVCQVNPRDGSRREVGLVWAQKMGHDIGAKALEVIQHSSFESSGPLRIISQTIEIPQRQIDARLLAWAHRHQPVAAEAPLLSNYGVELHHKLKPPWVSLDDMFKTVYWSNFYANEIMTLERLQREQPLLPLRLKVLAQDNWAMVTLPCELFVEWGRAICEKSPFKHTLVVGLANGWNGYLPTVRAFECPGGYETKEVTSTMLVPEAGDMVLSTVLEMLAKARNEVSV